MTRPMPRRKSRPAALPVTTTATRNPVRCTPLPAATNRRPGATPDRALACLHAFHRWPTRPLTPPLPSLPSTSSHDRRLARLTHTDLDRRIAQARRRRADADRQVAALESLRTAMSAHTAATYGGLPQYVRERYLQALADRWPL